PMALLAQHVMDPPPPLRSQEALSDAVERAVHRALAKDRVERFASVSEFADALFVVAAEPPADARRLPGGALPSRASALPVPLTPLIGRENDVRTVQSLLLRESV